MMTDDSRLPDSHTASYVKNLYKDHCEDYSEEKRKGWRVDMEKILHAEMDWQRCQASEC